MRLPALCLLLACALPAAAWSQDAPDRPPPLPTRDMTLDATLDTTDATGAHPPAGIRIRYNAASHRMRIDTKGRDDYMILDPQGGRTLLVSAAHRAWREQPFRPAAHAMFMLAASYSFARLAQATVAGLPCTTWNLQGATVGGTTCVTDDGVVLRLETADTDGDGDDFKLRVVATRVTYAPQPPGDFDLPAGYRRIGPKKTP